MVSTQSRRLPLQIEINSAAAKRAVEVLSSKGIGLPCKIVAVNDQTVTVAFTVQELALPNMTVPIAEPLYSRAPYQIGDRGVVLSADASLTEVSGQSTAQPKFQACGNLGALFFFPISNTGWADMPDRTLYLLQGPNGFLIRSLDNTVSINGKSGSGLVLTYGGSSITMASGTITLDAPEVVVTGNLIVADGATGTTVDANGVTTTITCGVTTNITDLA